MCHADRALAGFEARTEADRRLLEWDYRDHEGRTTAEIHAERPEWQSVSGRLSRRGTRWVPGPAVW
jgi:broad specificity phosphatase PhoE